MKWLKQMKLEMWCDLVAVTFALICFGVAVALTVYFFVLSFA